MVCFVVLRASGRGGLAGFVGFDLSFVVGARVGAGASVACVAVAVCLPRLRRVTGMKDEAAEA